jgi:hypothetical protein
MKAEETLWRRVADLFGRTPPELLSPHSVQLGGEMIQDPWNDEILFRNTNSSCKFCHAFTIFHITAV